MFSSQDLFCGEMFFLFLLLKVSDFLHFPGYILRDRDLAWTPSVHPDFGRESINNCETKAAQRKQEFPVESECSCKTQ